MKYKDEDFADGDDGATVVTQLLLNDAVNKQVDDAAAMITGLSRGVVVKWSSANNRWEALNGTIALSGSETLGIIEHVDEDDDTVGQVRVGGVYTDSGLAANTAYYVQADGSLGTTATEVAFGRTTSAGRLIQPGSGGGGSVNPLVEQTLTYNAAGQHTQAVIDATTYTMTYDSLNRLSTVSGGSTTMTCVYNAYGQFTGTTIA